MEHALELARFAKEQGEVPVGAVIVYENKIIGEGWNQSISGHDPTAHAEIVALRQAARYLNNYRLIDCDLYVTLEPCAMCAGAMVHSRITSLTYGAADPRTGAAGSVFQLLQSPHLNHKVNIVSDVLSDDCSTMLKDFFRSRR